MPASICTEIKNVPAKVMLGLKYKKRLADLKNLSIFQFRKTILIGKLSTVYWLSFFWGKRIISSRRQLIDRSIERTSWSEWMKDFSNWYILFLHLIIWLAVSTRTIPNRKVFNVWTCDTFDLWSVISMIIDGHIFYFIRWIIYGIAYENLKK